MGYLNDYYSGTETKKTTSSSSGGYLQQYRTQQKNVKVTDNKKTTTSKKTTTGSKKIGDYLFSFKQPDYRTGYQKYQDILGIAKGTTDYGGAKPKQEDQIVVKPKQKKLTKSQLEILNKQTRDPVAGASAQIQGLQPQQPSEKFGAFKAGGVRLKGTLKNALSLFVGWQESQAQYQLDLQKKYKREGSTVYTDKYFKDREEGLKKMQKLQKDLSTSATEDYKKSVEIAKEAIPDYEELNSKPFKEKVTDPRWLGLATLENVPSMLLSYGAGVVTFLATKNPVAGTYVGGATSFAQNAGDAYEDTKEFDLDEDTAESVAIITGLFTAPLDAIPVFKILNRNGGGKVITRTVTKNIVKETVKKVGKAGGKVGVQALFEGGTEAGQEIITNAVAQTYDEERGLLEGVPESFVVGAILGGGAEVAGTGFDLASGEQQKDLKDAIRSGEQDPDEVIGQVIASGQENTEEGKEIIKFALEAKKQGTTVEIEDQSPIEEQVVDEEIETAPEEVDLTPQVAEAKTAEEFIAKYNERAGYRGSQDATEGVPDTSITYIADATETGKNYARAYTLKGDGEGTINKYIISPDAKIFDLRNEEDKARLQERLTDQEFQSIIEASREGVMDWASLDEDVLIELGYDGAKLFERAKGFNLFNESGKLEPAKEDVLSTAIFNKDVLSVAKSDEELAQIYESTKTEEPTFEQTIPDVDKAKDYTSAEDFADAVYGAKPNQQIGLIDADRITPRDDIASGEERTSLLEDIRENGIKDVVRVTVEGDEIVTTDGSQRTDISQELGRQVPVIVNEGTIDGLQTIEELYNENAVKVTEKKKTKEKTKKKTYRGKAVPREQLPVKSEGKKKVSRLEARVKKLLDTASPETVEELGIAKYNEMNKEENIALAVDFVQEDPQRALEVLAGNEQAPKGILTNSIYIAMERLAQGDLELARRLASLRSTRLGQEISILTELDTDSPVRYMKEVIRVREQVFDRRYKKRSQSEVTKKTVESIKKSIKKPSKSQWSSFLNEIKC